MSSFEKRAKERHRITARFSLSDDGLMTLKVIGIAKKPQGGLVCMASSIPVDGIPGQARRRKLEETYVRRLAKRIRAFERGELPVPAEGSFIVDNARLIDPV
jgi:hypothetical protein